MTERQMAASTKSVEQFPRPRRIKEQLPRAINRKADTTTLVGAGVPRFVRVVNLLPCSAEIEVISNLDQLIDDDLMSARAVIRDVAR